MKNVIGVLLAVVAVLVLLELLDPSGQPTASQTATARTGCTGLINIGSCNNDIAQRQEPPKPAEKPWYQDGGTWLLLAAGGSVIVIAALYGRSHPSAQE